MIDRHLKSKIKYLLRNHPSVVLLGPRQVGKTTLARVIADELDALYLDLQLPSDLLMLSDAERYFIEHEQRLVIIDEIHRYPNLFGILRSMIDTGRQRGLRNNRFLLLGSASMDLMHQSSESLAGRIAYLELTPFSVLEIDDRYLDRLWVRGGFPDSFLAEDEELSLSWRREFIRTYLERDVLELGPRIPAETLRRLWTMLAHWQTGPLNISTLARNLEVSGVTVSRYIDLMVDLLLVRKLQPWHHNLRKRLIKAPKVYLRDSGVNHALLELENKKKIVSHPVVGASWEGFVIENILGNLNYLYQANYYRTAGGAEIDLLITKGGHKPWAIEIKRTTAPKPSKGFHFACQDIQPARKIIVCPTNKRFSIAGGIEIMGLGELCRELI